MLTRLSPATSLLRILRSKSCQEISCDGIVSTHIIIIIVLSLLHVENTSHHAIASHWSLFFCYRIMFYPRLLQPCYSHSHASLYYISLYYNCSNKSYRCISHPSLGMYLFLNYLFVQCSNSSSHYKPRLHCLNSYSTIRRLVEFDC